MKRKEAGAHYLLRVTAAKARAGGGTRQHSSLPLMLWLCKP